METNAEGTATEKRQRRPLRAVHWTILLTLVGLLAGTAVVVTASLALSAIDKHASTLARQTIPADQALEATSAAARTGQVAFIDALASADPLSQGAAIDRAQQAGRRQDSSWAAYLRLAGRSTDERRLQRETHAAFEQSRLLASTLIGASPTDPAYAAHLASERTSSARGLTLIDQLQTRFYNPATKNGTSAVASNVSSGRLAITIASAVALISFLALGAAMFRRVRRDERIASDTARVRAVETRHADIETRLQRALEMESTEEGTFSVIRQGLKTVAYGRAVELLVADNSQAHFHQVLSTVDDGVGACRVAAPGECPAASSGQTRLFEDSGNLDTCPYLRDHPERVWASCVPVSIAGRTTGVLHAEGPIDTPPNVGLTTELELVARKSGDRIGVLRVLARTEAQAQADPLTGLPNRRTLENRTHELLANDREFIVAFADLDHFKNLNDLHGHETGDRALRLFSRVLRDGIRPRDIPARYGGEEFVVVLPECSMADAGVVAERIRSQLAAALGSGSVPQFTVSIGLAAADSGEALSEVIARADGALLKAKQLGRDRVVIAGEPLETPPGGLAPVATTDPPAAAPARVTPISGAL